jgi:hypothetical protein
MNFETYLKNTTEEMSERQTVGLAMYYLLHEEGRDSIAASGVRDFLRNEPADVPDKNVSKYPSQLRRDGLFKQPNSEYRLTLDGKDHYSGLVDLPTGGEQPREDSFLGDVDPPDQFYETLVDDIERTYTHRVYDATLVLTRKLLENLLIDTLRSHYGTGEGLSLFFEPEQGRHKPFSDILESFKDCSDDLQMYGPRLSEKEFYDSLEELKDGGDASAHSIVVDVTDDEIEELSEEVQKVVPLLFRVQKQLYTAVE